MNSYTEKDARVWVDENMEGIMKAYVECKEIPAWMRDNGRFLECWKAGCWLGEMLKENGASRKQCQDIGFVHGQRSALAPASHTWTWAVHYANEFLYNSKIQDKPGNELADKIIAETIVIV